MSHRLLRSRVAQGGPLAWLVDAMQSCAVGPTTPRIASPQARESSSRLVRWGRRNGHRYERSRAVSREGCGCQDRRRNRCGPHRRALEISSPQQTLAAGIQGHRVRKWIRSRHPSRAALWPIQAPGPAIEITAPHRRRRDTALWSMISGRSGAPPTCCQPCRTDSRHARRVTTYFDNRPTSRRPCVPTRG